MRIGQQHSQSHGRYAFNMAETAKGTAKAFEVIPSANGFENGFEIHEDPTPPQGTILDSHEQPIEPAEVFVGVRVDQKTKAVTAGPFVTGVISVSLLAVGYLGSSLLHYQSQTDQVTNNSKRIEKLEASVEKLGEMNLTITKMQGDLEAVRENQKRTEKIANDVADIRILLAQKGLGGSQ